MLPARWLDPPPVEASRRPGVLPEAATLPIGIEACASSHYWSRRAPGVGHTVPLMPPAYVKPYVKRQKNDMADAEAICEAVTRANMRFVPTKTPEQQSCLMLHRTRHLFIRQQTAVINAIRAHLAEFGIVAPVGRKGVTELLHVVADRSDGRVPEVARACLAALGTQLLGLEQQIVEFDRLIMAWSRSNETSKRLHYILGSVRYWRRLWPRASLTRSLPIRAQLLGLDRARTEAATYQRMFSFRSPRQRRLNERQR